MNHIYVNLCLLGRLCRYYNKMLSLDFKKKNVVTTRCRCHRAPEQEVLPDGVFHGGEEQHEGDPLVLGPHLPALPLLRPPPPAPAGLYRHPGRAAPAAGPAPAAAQQTGLGAQPQQRRRAGRRPGRPRAALAPQPPLGGRTVVLRERLGGLHVRPRGLSEEAMSLDMTGRPEPYLLLNTGRCSVPFGI